MSGIVKIIILSLTSLVCAVIAGYLAINSTEGWGWFLFAAIVALGTDQFKVVTKEKIDND